MLCFVLGCRHARSLRTIIEWCVCVCLCPCPQVALTDALQIPVVVVCLDRSGAGGFMGGGDGGSDPDTNMHAFVPEACAAAGQTPRVHVLYRPGHYDILYRRP